MLFEYKNDRFNKYQEDVKTFAQKTWQKAA